MASGRQIAINGHIKFNLTIPLQQLNGLETLVIIMVSNKYAFLQITRRRFLNEWEAFKKVISRRNIRRRITIPLRSEERFSRNAETDLVCRLLLEKKNIAYLNFYFKGTPTLLQIGLSRFNGLFNASGKIDVVVLEHNHVVQAHAVVDAPSDAYRFLFEPAHTRRGFARVEHLGF